ncbi:hypothetical protein DMC14_002455 [Metamycoplasma phocicerebrale]|uniref:Lipopolysaccharide cholinephosphotransferase n=1 Tax=Metamycoplasma phocicerebrale TaxID=142649 RepID=A0A3T0TU36_9BACT|nr:hypothetical protein [Metamycoplasma phocicerebrale]AZZ65632.1 hypothetical protein DMC14_002455 [Metamycoplasma phocicerebrale]
MNNIFENKLNILKEFMEICNENSLWYSLDSNTLLALVNNLSYWDQIDHYDVMMTFDSYEKLRNLFPNKVIDSVKHSDYLSLQNKFVFDVSKIYEECPFVNINLVIPTTTKRVKKYLKYKNRIKAFVNHFSTMNLTNISKIKSKIRTAKFLKPVVKGINYKDIYNILYDEENEGFLVTSPLINKKSLKKWITNISYKLINIEKNDLKFKAIYEYDYYLKSHYGRNWSKIEEIEIDYLHKNVIDIDKYETIIDENNI